MASYLNVCRFTATSSGTGDFVVSAAVTGYQTPANAGAVNGAVYRYRAESSDLTEWEIGYGTYTTSSTTLTRTEVLYNSADTGTGSGQSGAGSKINFTAAPQVAIVALAEDLRDKLTADRSYYVTTNGSDSNSGRATATTGTVTFTNGSTSVGWTAHGRSVGDAVQLTTTGTLPTNFSAPNNASASGIYFIKTAPDANTVTLSATPAGSAISAGSAGSGTHTATLLSPFLTIQQAINTAAALDSSIYNVTIWVSAGTFTAANTLKWFIGSGTYYICGAGASNTTVDGNSDICFLGSNCGTWEVNAVKLTGTYGFLIGGKRSSVSARNHEISTVTTYGCRVTSGAALRYYAHTISASMTRYCSVDTQGAFTCVSVTVTLSGTPDWSYAMFALSGLAYVTVEGVTWSGSATGERYTVIQNSVLYTGGQATTWLPGDAAHATPTASGGQYV